MFYLSVSSMGETLQCEARHEVRSSVLPLPPSCLLYVNSSRLCGSDAVTLRSCALSSLAQNVANGFFGKIISRSHQYLIHSAASEHFASLNGFALLVHPQAIVRSASLGGNIYNSVSPTTKPIPTSAAAAATWTAASIERENLVRTLAAILRCPLVANRAHPEHISGVRVPAPSSNVHDDDQNQEEYGAGPSMTKVKKESISDHSRVVAANPRKALEGTEEFPRYATKTAEEHGLVSALIGFLPPAREDGLEGVTKNSVALIPGWSAPPSLTANVCGCLLHLLGDSEAGTSVANQVRPTFTKSSNVGVRELECNRQFFRGSRCGGSLSTVSNIPVYWFTRFKLSSSNLPGAGQNSAASVITYISMSHTPFADI